MSGRINHGRVPLTGEKIPLTCGWEASGLIISNMADAVLEVTTARGDRWRVPPGKTLRRLVVVPQRVFYGRMETPATTGEALIVVTEAPVLELAGEDASIAGLFRRTVFDRTFSVNNGQTDGVTVVVPLGAARRMQVIADVEVSAPTGSVLLNFFDMGEFGVQQTIAYMLIPYNAPYGTAIRWQMGEGWSLPLPQSPKVTLFVVGGSGGGNAVVSARIDVWE